MTRQDLDHAGMRLDGAADTVSDTDVESRLRDQAEQLRDLASRERGPDHGRLARHERVLADIETRTGEEAREAIQEALENIRSYRETVDGV